MLGVLKRTISMNQALHDLNLTNMYTVPRVEGIYFIFHLKLFKVGRVGFVLLSKYILMNDGVV